MPMVMMIAKMLATSYDNKTKIRIINLPVGSDLHSEPPYYKDFPIRQQTLPLTQILKNLHPFNLNFNKS